ncbi:MAG: hypothetical protein K2H53_06765 [Clostridia bacterium]|nr:hypothetical protein [Clostridia bacterium]
MFDRMIKPETHCGDEPNEYDILFRESCTVRTFINTVLANYRQEWGCIKVVNCHSALKDSCIYKYGILESEMNDDIMDKQIESATGFGGWSNVDYVLYLKAPSLESKCKSRKQWRFPLPDILTKEDVKKK